jgi:hypothetical protein
MNCCLSVSFLYLRQLVVFFVLPWFKGGCGFKHKPKEMFLEYTFKLLELFGQDHIISSLHEKKLKCLILVFACAYSVISMCATLYCFPSLVL